MPTSPLFASQTPALSAVPISEGSGGAAASLDAWVSNGSGGGGIDLQTALDGLSTTHGAIIFRGSTAWQALEPGVPGGFLTTNGAGVDVSWSSGAANIYGLWVAAVDAAGGTYETDSKTICEALADELEAASYYTKIIWLLPLLGANLAAARVPLIDVFGVGIAGNTGFVDADFDQATGLQGNGTSKILDTFVKPSQLGVANNGGLGYVENNVSFAGTGVEPIGCYDNNPYLNRYALDLRSNVRRIRWGNPSNGAGDGSSAGNGRYYGQRSVAILREMFFNASSLGTDTVSDGAVGAADQNITLMGSVAGTTTYWAGRCACAYMTDGTLSGAEVTALDTLLQTYLLTPTGR